MYSLNFEEPIHVHFIGIGGISMSGLAEILLEEGFTISGSDAKQSALTDSLAKKAQPFTLARKHLTYPSVLHWLSILLPSARTMRNLNQP